MKNVIVTGTSRGIGLECVQWLSKLGHNVLAVSRKISDKLIDLDNVTCLAVDITKEEDLQKVVDYVQDN